MAFENIIGHEKNKKILESSIRNNNILHSYLFCGEEGIGKFTLAKEFAKAIVCENKEIAPCNKCKACIEFEGENNPDFNVIEPDGNVIKIEQIRYMNSKIWEKPLNGTKKVYIINDSDKMRIEAQNALLKTLEEPPEYAVIILICKQEGNLLVTIKSRCTRLDFQSLNDEQLKMYFTKIGKTVENDILNMSNGSIYKALKNIENQDIYISLKNLIYNIENMNKLDILKQNFIYKEKDNIFDLLEIMNSILFQISKENLKYLNCIEIVEKAKRSLRGNSNFDMCIDNLLLSIWEEVNEKYSRS